MEVLEGESTSLCSRYWIQQVLRGGLDFNITRIIIALALFEFATGSGKGFAVTLSVGTIVNSFTAVLVAKAVFNLILEGKLVDKLSI